MNEHRDNSQRLTVDFHGIDAGSYENVTADIVAKFELEVAGAKTSGLDEVFQVFKRGSDMIGLEWDNWSGYIVNAKSKSAEPLVREIAGYIRATYSS